MLRQYLNLMLVLGILWIFACAGIRSNNAGSITGGKLITPRNLKDITGIEWILSRMTNDNDTISLVENSKTTFACDEKGNVTGKAPINRYSGNLQLQDDGQIIWNKAFIMTRMAGPPDLMQQEADFTGALMKTSHMYIKESGLVLISEDRSTVLEFK